MALHRQRNKATALCRARLEPEQMLPLFMAAGEQMHGIVLTAAAHKSAAAIPARQASRLSASLPRVPPPPLPSEASALGQPAAAQGPSDISIPSQVHRQEVGRQLNLLAHLEGGQAAVGAAAAAERVAQAALLGGGSMR